MHARAFHSAGRAQQRSKNGGPDQIRSPEPRGSKYPTFKDSVPEAIKGMAFGTRALKYSALGPSGEDILGETKRITG